MNTNDIITNLRSLITAQDAYLATPANKRPYLNNMIFMISTSDSSGCTNDDVTLAHTIAVWRHAAKSALKTIKRMYNAPKSEVRFDRQYLGSPCSLSYIKHRVAISPYDYEGSKHADFTAAQDRAIKVLNFVGVL